MAEDKTSIFRKKSIEDISSPEQINDYLRVTTPGVWIVLAAIIILIMGLFAWSMAGSLETYADGVAYVENGQALITVSTENRNLIEEDMPVIIDEAEFTIASVEYNGKAYAEVALEDGSYDAIIVVERIHPVQFLIGQ